MDANDIVLILVGIFGLSLLMKQAATDTSATTTADASSTASLASYLKSLLKPSGGSSGGGSGSGKSSGSDSGPGAGSAGNSGTFNLGDYLQSIEDGATGEAILANGGGDPVSVTQTPDTDSYLPTESVPDLPVFSNVYDPTQADSGGGGENYFDGGDDDDDDED